MKDQSILYIMNGAWNGEKHRERLVAERLSHNYNMTIRYRRPKNTPRFLRTERRMICSFRFLDFSKIPILKHLRFMSLINNCMARRTFGSLENYDYVWLTDATLFSAVDYLISKKTVIVWDCTNEANNEKILIKRANYIFCPSKELSKKIQQRTGIKRNDIIINSEETNYTQILKR